MKPTTINKEILLGEVQKAYEIVRHGGIILYPTDTVWGLGCDASNPTAVKKVMALKQRSEQKSFILLVADKYMVERFVVQVPEIAWDLVDMSDKPLTIIYPEGNGLPAEVLGPDGSVALRIPRHAFCQSLIRRLQRPLLSTSANISGQKSPASFAQLDPQLVKQVDWVAPSFLETGATGKASSIIKLGIDGQVAIIRP